ncbi:MAG: hypothetical protein Q8P18_21385 [Pseudomonadota bacterium]|nr:hypothetical protein [Pseudomonadota bacterium]
MDDDDFKLKPSTLLLLSLLSLLSLLARLEDLKATPEQLARAATLDLDDLRRLVEAVERWPWLMPGR